jgi:hypothetical protein
MDFSRNNQIESADCADERGFFICANLRNLRTRLFPAAGQ